KVAFSAMSGPRHCRQGFSPAASRAGWRYTRYAMTIHPALPSIPDSPGNFCRDAKASTAQARAVQLEWRCNGLTLVPMRFPRRLRLPDPTRLSPDVLASRTLVIFNARNAAFEELGLDHDKRRLLYRKSGSCAKCPWEMPPLPEARWHPGQADARDGEKQVAILACHPVFVTKWLRLERILRYRVADQGHRLRRFQRVSWQAPARAAFQLP